MSQAVICDQGVIDGDTVNAISWLEPEHEWDTGFMLFSGPPDATDDGGLLHLDCVLDQHPEIGNGLELAREHGEAIYAGTSWVPSNGV